MSLSQKLRTLFFGPKPLPLLSLEFQHEYCKIGEATAYQILNIFCNIIENLYTKRYLREPTAGSLTSTMPAAFQAALGMEKLPQCIGWPVQGKRKETNCGSGSCCQSTTVNLECIFWNSRGA
jgi:hypothetical protein